MGPHLCRGQEYLPETITMRLNSKRVFNCHQMLQYYVTIALFHTVLRTNGMCTSTSNSLEYNCTTKLVLSTCTLVTAAYCFGTLVE